MNQPECKSSCGVQLEPLQLPNPLPCGAALVRFQEAFTAIATDLITNYEYSYIPEHSRYSTKLHVSYDFLHSGDFLVARLIFRDGDSESSSNVEFPYDFPCFSCVSTATDGFNNATYVKLRPIYSVCEDLKTFILRKLRKEKRIKIVDVTPFVFHTAQTTTQTNNSVPNTALSYANNSTNLVSTTTTSATGVPASPTTAYTLDTIRQLNLHLVKILSCLYVVVRPRITDRTNTSYPVGFSRKVQICIDDIVGDILNNQVQNLFSVRFRPLTVYKTTDLATLQKMLKSYSDQLSAPNITNDQQQQLQQAITTLTAQIQTTPDVEFMTLDFVDPCVTIANPVASNFLDDLVVLPMDQSTPIVHQMMFDFAVVFHRNPETGSLKIVDTRIDHVEDDPRTQMALNSILIQWNRVLEQQFKYNIGISTSPTLVQ